MGEIPGKEKAVSNLTFDEVIEQHRVAIGAERAHVTLGDEATPEGLQVELARLAAKDAEYRAIPEVIRLRAHIECLMDLLRRIGRLGQSNFAEFESEPEAVRSLKKQVFRLTDIISWDRDYAIRYAAAISAGQKPPPVAAAIRGEG